jgi:hypothetical protein
VSDGIFEAEEQRNAFIEWRDRTLAGEAERLKVIGITSVDDLTTKYGALCHLYETTFHDDDDEEILEVGDILLTSDDAREFADMVLQIMYGGEWREPT